MTRYPKHVGYYLDNTNKEFDDQLEGLLIKLDLEDCINLLKYLQARIKREVEIAELVNMSQPMGHDPE